MNKSDLVATVATLSGLAKNDAEKAVDSVFDAIAASRQPKFSAGKGLKEAVNG